MMLGKEKHMDRLLCYIAQGTGPSDFLKADTVPERNNLVS